MDCIRSPSLRIKSPSAGSWMPGSPAVSPTQDRSIPRCVVPRSLRCRFASSTAVLAVNAMSCQRDEVVRLRKGQEIALPEGPTTVRRIVNGREQGSTGYFVAGDLRAVRVESGPLDVRLQTFTSEPARVCQ